MLHAVQAPVLKLVAVAGAALAASAFAVPCESHHKVIVQRLQLHAPEEPNAIYLTRFSHGDLLFKLSDGGPKTIVIHNRARVFDGCDWLGTERMVPAGADRYLYSYTETILSCEPGATPALKTPRTGYVLVVDSFTP